MPKLARIKLQNGEEEKLSPGEVKILERLKEIESEVKDLSDQVEELKQEIKEEV